MSREKGRAMSTSLSPPPNLHPSRGRGKRAALKKDVDMALLDRRANTTRHMLIV
jgi:hypothetical protein